MDALAGPRIGGGRASATAIAPPPARAVDIAARLDRLPVSPLHAAIVVLCALGLLFDVVEAALSNALSAVFSAAPYHVAPDQLSLLLAAVFAGGAIGAPILGWLADRHGRRTVLAAALVVLAATSLMAATSSDVASLTAIRVLSGLALGAYPPLMVAYLSDLLPPARRGMLILLCGAIGFLGAPAVIFLVRWLTPIEPFGLAAWRWALMLGGIGAAAVGALFWTLPESPRWLAAAGRPSEAEASCRRMERSAGVGFAPASAPEQAATAGQGGAEAALPNQQRFWSAEGRLYRLRAGLLGALYFLSPWATIGFPLLSGAVLIQKGFQVADSLLYVGITMFGPSLGVLVGGAIIDRLERRTSLALCAGAMAILGLAFAASAAPAAVIGTGIAFNLVGAIYVAALSVYAAELFPTALRAAASSGAWAVNRVASALVPLALLPLLKSAGAMAMFAVVAVALVASVALVLLLGPRGLAGRPVE
jgi:MFS transporter, putative metabolite:H+ symporter